MKEDGFSYLSKGLWSHFSRSKSWNCTWKAIRRWQFLSCTLWVWDDVSHIPWHGHPRLGHWNMNLHWYYLVSTLHFEKTKPASYRGDGLLEALCWDVAPAAPRFVSAPLVPLTRAVAGIGTEEEGSIWGPRGSEEGKVCFKKSPKVSFTWLLTMWRRNH